MRLESIRIGMEVKAIDKTINLDFKMFSEHYYNNTKPLIVHSFDNGFINCFCNKNGTDANGTFAFNPCDLKPFKENLFETEE